MPNPESPEAPKGSTSSSSPFFIPPDRDELQLEHPFFNKSQQAQESSGEPTSTDSAAAATEARSERPAVQPAATVGVKPSAAPVAVVKPKTRWVLWGAIAAFAVANAVQFAVLPTMTETPAPAPTAQSAAPTTEPSPVATDDGAPVLTDLSEDFWASEAGANYQRVVTSVELETTEDGVETLSAATRIIAPEIGTDDTRASESAVEVCNVMEEYLAAEGKTDVAVDVHQLNGDIYATNTAASCTEI